VIPGARDRKVKAMRILVATDESGAAHRALDFVAGLAWPAGTTIRIIEVVETDPPIYAVGSVAALAEGLEVPSLRQAAATVSASERHLSGRDFAVEGSVLHGRRATEVIREARRFRADLIVLGSRGHGTIEAMLLGSVSAEIAEHANVPVLVVRGSKPRLEHVMVAWDQSPAARAAVELLKRWPAFGPTSIRVLSVNDLGAPWWAGFPTPGAAESSGLYLVAANDTRRARAAMARELADELRIAGHPATGISAEGQPAVRIIDAAAEWPADLVVMGTHARHGLSRLLLGSVARNVVLHAGCSVLVVPTQAAVSAAGAEAELEPAGVATAAR
jgi:nucleotide-binding universal stress UspA family protein